MSKYPNPRLHTAFWLYAKHMGFMQYLQINYIPDNTIIWSTAIEASWTRVLQELKSNEGVIGPPKELYRHTHLYFWMK